MLIPENNLPEIHIIRSLYYSAARKYEVEITDMDSLFDIFDDLTKDIIESSFLSYKDKMSMCNEVNKVKNELIKKETVTVTERLEEEISNNDTLRPVFYRERRLYSAMSSFIIASMLLFLLQYKEGKVIKILRELDMVTMVPILLLILVLLLTVLNFILYEMKRSRRKDEWSKDFNED